MYVFNKIKKVEKCVAQQNKGNRVNKGLHKTKKINVGLNKIKKAE